MTADQAAPQPQGANPDRWKSLVILLILINTIFAAAIAGLQTDASIRSSLANRDSQYYSFRVSGQVVRAQIQSGYDLSAFSDALLSIQKSSILEYTALERQIASDDRGYQDLMIESQAEAARADRAKALCIFFTNPRYAAADEFSLPDTQTYLDDVHAEAFRLLDQQNLASDLYHHWNSKADAYVTVLTILAIAFFLLGVAQMARPGVRLLFAGFACAVMGISVLWTLVLILF